MSSKAIIIVAVVILLAIVVTSTALTSCSKCKNKKDECCCCPCGGGNLIVSCDHLNNIFVIVTFSNNITPAAYRVGTVGVYAAPILPITPVTANQANLILGGPVFAYEPFNNILIVNFNNNTVASPVGPDTFIYVDFPAVIDVQSSLVQFSGLADPPTSIDFTPTNPNITTIALMGAQPTTGQSPSTTQRIRNRLLFLRLGGIPPFPPFPPNGLADCSGKILLYLFLAEGIA